MNTYVRAQVDTETKQAATKILAGMGLSVSDAIRLMLLDVVNRHSFEVPDVPNDDTVAAIEELRAGRGVKFQSMDSFRVWLNADD